MIKKRRKLAQWVCTDNEQLNIDSIGQRIVTVFFDVVSVLVFVIAARMMLSEIFGFGGVSIGGIFAALLVALIVSGIMEYIDYTDYIPSEKKKISNIIFLIAGIVLCLLYLFIFKTGDKIIGGTQKFVANFYQKWNVYYDTNIPLPKPKFGSVELGVGFLFVIVIFVSLWLAKFLGRKLILITIPLLVIMLEVTVGYAPGKKGIIVMFIGIVITNIYGFTKKEFKPAALNRNNRNFESRWIYGVAVAIMLVIFSISASKLVAPSVNKAMKYSANVKQIQERMLENFSISQLLKDIGELFWDNNEDGEIISNTKLSFKNVPVMKLYLSDKPKDTIYLKDFYGSSYVGGRWLTEADDFEQAASKAGFDVEEIKENIANMGMSSIEERMLYISSSDMKYISARLKYLKGKNTNAYVPYFSNLIGDKLSIKGDVYYTKSKKSDEISYYIGEPGYNYGVSMILSDDIEKEDWEIWYEKYVKDNYLDVPDNMTYIKDYAKTIKAGNDLENLNGGSGENELRLTVADAVADWFAKNVEYTTEPPKLPRNMDPIEYFVGQTKRGYCMHYASAATLILRELGVPARYASGYYVSKSIFEEKDGEQVGVIIDNTAHAWVEIYLEGIGWVPIEVTTSYRGDNDVNPNIPNNDKDKDSDVNQNDDPEVDTEEKPEETKDNETQPNEETSTPKETEGEKQTDEAGNVINNEDPTRGAGYYGTGNGAFKKGIIGKVFLFAGIALLIGGAVYMIIRYKRRQEEKLNILIKKNRTVRAIKFINEKMYKTLKKKGKLVGSNHNDASYKEALMKTYPEITNEEWDKYMAIVREVAFSNNDEAVENMEFCYDIYKKVRK